VWVVEVVAEDDQDNVGIEDANFVGDTDEPDVTFIVGGQDLADDDEIAYLPVLWITIVFDDEEFADVAEFELDDEDYDDDPYDTVTVTMCELDGVDVLDQLGTTDDKEFNLPVEDIAEGDHNIDVRAEDEAGNEAHEDDDFEITAAETIDIDLSPGWNLMSVPGPLTDASLDVVIADVVDDVTKIRTYDAATGLWAGAEVVDGAWVTETGYAALTTIEPGKGYYVECDAFAELEVIPQPRDPMAQLVTYDLEAGWNLIGFVSALFPAEETKAVTAYLISVTADDEWSILYSYDPDPSVGYQYVDFSGAVSDDFTLNEADEAVVEEGRGYWIYMLEEGVLVP
jgi:hypothetical protein